METRASGLDPVQLDSGGLHDCSDLWPERLPLGVGEGFFLSCFHGSKTLPFALHDAGKDIMRPTEGAVVPFGRISVLFLDCIELVVDPLDLIPLVGTNFANMSLQNFHDVLLSKESP